jgi:chromosome segregation ATPase
MAKDDSSDDDSSSYETDSDSSDDEPEVFSYPAHTRTPMKLKVATTPNGKKSVVEDDSSSSYDTESDSDASGGKQPLRKSSMKKISAYADSGGSTSGESFGGCHSSDDGGKLSPEEEKKRQFLGDTAYAAHQEKRAEIRLDGKVNLMSHDRIKAERDNRYNTRKLDRESREYKKDMDEIKESNKDLDMNSTDLIKKSRDLIRKSSSDMEELKVMQASLDKDNNDLDCASQHWAKDAEDFEKMRKKLETEKVREEVDYVVAAKKNKEAAQEAKMEARRERQERMKERREREEEEEKHKEAAEKHAKEEKKKAEHGSEKNRMERAYGWYNKLSFPAKEDMRERIAKINNVDISVDDVDLLPWTTGGKRVNVAKMNMVLFAR